MRPISDVCPSDLISMSISIYYSFRHAKDLANSGDLHAAQKAWSDAFEGKPYEDWCWYTPTQQDGVWTYSGATKVPNSPKKAWGAIQLAAQLLSKMRVTHIGTEWSVSVDDHELPWREDQRRFDPN